MHEYSPHTTIEHVHQISKTPDVLASSGGEKPLYLPRDMEWKGQRVSDVVKYLQKKLGKCILISTLYDEF